MKIRLLLSVAAALFLLSPTHAQDRLYKKNGEILQVKIKEIGTRTITYKKYDNQDGPDYVVGKNEVDKVKYENGTEDEINGRSPRPGHPPMPSMHLSDDAYGKNILALAPIVMTNTSATGFGLSYERVLDKRNIFSFYLPVAYSFQNNSNYNYSSGNNTDGKDHMFWAYPGVKIYPTGSNRVVSYAVGISLPIASGVETQSINTYDPQTGSTITNTVDDNIFLMGAMLTNFLNIQPTERLYLGLELGFGVPYIYEHDQDQVNYNYNTPYENTPLIQFSFRAGFRF
jgi:hypothetical protein